MAVRPLLTTAVSVAAAVTVTASMALAPPLAPRDVKIVKDTQVALSADEGLIKALIDGYFYDGDGTEGIFQALLNRFAGGDTAATALINDYFDVAPQYALGQYLLANTTDPAIAEYIKAYFGGSDPSVPFGPPEAERLWLLQHFQDPVQQHVINEYFDGGPPAVIEEQLLSRFQDPQQQEFITDYFSGGPPAVIRKQLITRFTDPQQQKTINDYFGDPANPDPNGQIGPPAVIRTQLLSRFTDPAQQEFIKEYFGDPNNEGAFGPGIVIRDQLLARTSDPVQQALIAGYFAGGPKEVLRLLFDPVDSTPAPVMAFSARAAAPETPDPVAPDDSTPAADSGTPAPTLAAATAPAPAATPAADPAPAKGSSKIAADSTGGATDVTDAMKDGNKVIVEPLGSSSSKDGKGGGDGFNVFNQLAAAVHVFVTGQQPTGNTPGAGAVTGGTTDAGSPGGS
jgi:hypothetical protein